MKDGTIKQKSPFDKAEVWYVPGRDSRPMRNVSDEEVPKDELNAEEEKCPFCYQNYMNTTPEKSRLTKENDNYIYKEKLDPDNIKNEKAEFRRISNLYEIVRYNYWEENYGYKLPKDLESWKESYISNETGKEHLKNIVRTKLTSLGLTKEEIETEIKDEKKFSTIVNPFFGGTHELIVPKNHYTNNAQFESDLMSSGELSPEEHYQYFQFTINAIKDILKSNRFVRYVTVFQNWLEQAGASINHLHRQLVGLDEWGSSTESLVKEVRKNKNLFNEFGTNFAIFHDLIFLENDYAVAYADYARRYPTIAIYSKSVNARPHEQTQEEIRGISDITHAVHKAMGNTLACNEEWYYTPTDAVDVIPFHILIKWRTITPAGFEGGTGIYINPISPVQVRDSLVPELFKLREENKLGNVRIAEECNVDYNMLQYYKYRQ